MHAYIFLDKLFNNMLPFCYLTESFSITNLHLTMFIVGQYMPYINDVNRPT